MKKKRILLVLLIFVFVLSACSGDVGGTPSLLQAVGPPHKDADGLAEVRLEDGGASIVLYPEKWPELWDMTGDEDVYLGEGSQGVTFKVNSLYGRVKEACIGKMPWISEVNPYILEHMPIVVFLMEDGYLQWLAVEFDWLVRGMEFGYDEVVNIWGSVPWIKDIVALSYEQQKEGNGQMTMFATDTEKLRYDLMSAMKLYSIHMKYWRCYLPKEGQFINLQFEFSNLTLEKGRNMEVEESYFGSYEIYLADDSVQGQRAGTITFDLERDMEKSFDIPGSPLEIKGSYFSVMENDGTLQLFLSEGDGFHSENGKDFTEYVFIDETANLTYTNFLEISDEEFIRFLLSSVPEAKKLVESAGMSVLVTGEMTEFEDSFVCRDIWLGTEGQDSFVREIFYTVSSWGQIFQYDPIAGTWIYPNTWLYP